MFLNELFIRLSMLFHLGVAPMRLWIATDGGQEGVVHARHRDELALVLLLVSEGMGLKDGWIRLVGALHSVETLRKTGEAEFRTHTMFGGVTSMLFLHWRLRVFAHNSLNILEVEGFIAAIGFDLLTSRVHLDLLLVIDGFFIVTFFIAVFFVGQIDESLLVAGQSLLIEFKLSLESILFRLLEDIADPLLELSGRQTIQETIGVIDHNLISRLLGIVVLLKIAMVGFQD